MKNLSSRRAKALAISPETKKKVLARDQGICVWCGRWGLPEAHFISRKRGGLGIEQNILTLCRICHDRYDHGDANDRWNMRLRFREYLQEKYPDWDENKLIYRKGEYNG